MNDGRVATHYILKPIHLPSICSSSVQSSLSNFSVALAVSGGLYYQF